MDGNALLRIFLDWVPFIIFVVLLIYFMKKGVGGRQAEFMDAARQYQTEHLMETRKIQASLERIASALEKAQTPR